MSPFNNENFAFSDDLGSPPRRLSGGSVNKHVIYSDRLIPNRLSSNLEEALDIAENPEVSKRAFSAGRENQLLLNGLLRSELLGQPMTAPSYSTNDIPDGQTADVGSPTRGRSSAGSNMLKYMSPSRGGSVGSPFVHEGAVASSSSRSPASSSRISVGDGSHKLKQSRKISRKPYKILEAPSLCDDYYLNLVDWSHGNVVAVALGSSVYLWSAHTAKVLDTALLGGVGD